MPLTNSNYQNRTNAFFAVATSYNFEAPALQTNIGARISCPLESRTPHTTFLPDFIVNKTLSTETPQSTRPPEASMVGIILLEI